MEPVDLRVNPPLFLWLVAVASPSYCVDATCENCKVYLTPDTLDERLDYCYFSFGLKGAPHVFKTGF